jgi:hypothetical protein
LFLVTVMSDAETTEATQLASLLRKFGREATASDKAKCNAVIGGKRAREDFRQQWADARKHIKTAKGSVSSSSIKTKMDTKEAIYQPFAMMVKGEGGQVDLLGATKRAANIARKYEAKGPPFIMYNPDSEALEYMYGKKTVTDSCGTSTVINETGEFDVDPSTLQLAMNDAKRTGLVDEIPNECRGKIDIAMPVTPQVGTSWGASSPAWGSTWSSGDGDRWCASTWACASEWSDSTGASAGWADSVHWSDASAFDSSRVAIKEEMPDPAFAEAKTEPSADDNAATTAAVKTPADTSSKKVVKKTSVELVFSEVQMLGRRLQSSIKKAMDIIQCIDTNDVWAWATHDRPNVFTACVRAEAIEATFKNDVFMKSFEHWKRTIDNDTSLANLKKHLIEGIRDLEAQVTPVVRMHASRNQTTRVFDPDEAKAKAKAKAAARKVSKAVSAV